MSARRKEGYMSVMTATDLRVETSLKIMKPAHEVFEAIIDPRKMSNYFISKGSGRLDEGMPVTWTWDDVNMQGEVRPGKIEPDKFISFYGSPGAEETLTEIRLNAVEPSATVVKITETGWSKDDAGIAMLANQTQGWTGFLFGLKAYLEHGVNLRKGSFDPSMMPAKMR
jgi:uncharacterized protein YndB with AHSA1/START domain